MTARTTRSRREMARPPSTETGPSTPIAMSHRVSVRSIPVNRGVTAVLPRWCLGNTGSRENGVFKPNLPNWRTEMDTVDFTPYRPGHRFSALVGAAAGLLLGVCGTTMITSAAADPAEQPTSDSAATRNVVAAQTAATHRQLHAVDCRYLADVRRIRHGMLPWSADAASEWLSHNRGARRP
jgi:hypothetical protein